MSEFEPPQSTDVNLIAGALDATYYQDTFTFGGWQFERVEGGKWKFVVGPTHMRAHDRFSSDEVARRYVAFIEERKARQRVVPPGSSFTTYTFGELHRLPSGTKLRELNSVVVWRMRHDGNQRWWDALNASYDTRSCADFADKMVELDYTDVMKARAELNGPDFRRYTFDELKEMPEGTQVRVANMQNWFRRTGEAWMNENGGTCPTDYFTGEWITVREPAKAAKLYRYTELTNTVEGTAVRVHGETLWFVRSYAEDGWVREDGDDFRNFFMLAGLPLEQSELPMPVPVLNEKFDPEDEEGGKLTVLGEAAKLVDGGEREEQYGPPEESFARIADLWSSYKGQEFAASDVAVMMMLLKIARGVHKRDSLVDIVGYARCLERILKL